jgi:hypothetical protein
MGVVRGFGMGVAPRRRAKGKQAWAVAHKYADVREELSRRFGGITASPALPGKAASTQRARRYMTTLLFSRS